MKAQIRSLEKACDNAETAVDFVSTADGALNEIHSMLQRMNELSIQAANGTMTYEEREAIDAEAKELCNEITRISDQTDFNACPILNGNFEYRGYVNNDRTDVKVLGYSEETKVGTFNIALDISAELITGTTDQYKYTLNSVSQAGTTKLCESLEGEIRGSVLTLKGEDGTELVMGLSGDAPSGTFEIELKKIGAMRVQVGDNEGEVIEMNIPEISLRRLVNHPENATVSNAYVLFSSYSFGSHVSIGDSLCWMTASSLSSDL